MYISIIILWCDIYFFVLNHCLKKGMADTRNNHYCHSLFQRQESEARCRSYPTERRHSWLCEHFHIEMNQKSYFYICQQSKYYGHYVMKCSRLCNATYNIHKIVPLLETGCICTIDLLNNNILPLLPQMPSGITVCLQLLCKCNFAEKLIVNEFL